MKKKIIALLLATVIVVGAALGGTLAYLTDGQGSVNVATVGNVKIKQFEMQRAGDKLVEFKQGQPLYPAYYTTDKPVTGTDGYWTGVEGAIDKIVYVENEGRSDAYIRTWIALECPEGMELGKDILVNKNDDADNGIEWTEDDAVIYTTIDGQRYAIICATYTEALIPGAKSVESLLQVAMAKHVNDEAYGGENNKTYEILAFTQAVQTKNMPTGVGVALVEAFGEPTLANIPWNADWVAENDVSDIVDEYNFVTNAVELAEALNNGESVTLANDIVLSESIVIQAAEAATYSLRSAAPAVELDLNGNNISITAKYDENNYEASSAIVNYGTLLITGEGTISAANNYTIRNNGTMVIEDVTVLNGIMNFGDLTVESGNISNSRSGKHAIYGNAATLTINGGTIHNENAGNATIFAYGGEVTLNDGEYTIADGTATLGWTSCLIDAQGNAKYEIYGGVFKGEIRDYNNNTTIYGGTFNNNPTRFVDASKAYIVENANGTWSVLPLYSYEEIDGATYQTNEATGEQALYLVPAEYEGATFTVADGTDKIGNYAFAYNTNVKIVELPTTVKDLGRGFDSSTVEKVILNEGLTTISSRAFKSTTALNEVVISSTVKTIADNAFQKSGIKTITIPATVETIGETAFGSSLVETVIIEGNTSIQGYAFRGCPNLRTVYLYGDDVTFIPSTLNGRNSTWFCNGESNNPNTSNITFYVQNETVAARVKAAMGAEANNTKIYFIADSVEDLKTAFANGGNYVVSTNIALDADETITLAEGKTLVIDLNGKTISGVTDDADKNDDGKITSADNEVMFDVRGTLTVKNGNLTYKHESDNLAWNGCTEIFYVAFNGTLNLNNVNAENLGGSDMAYVVDMVNATNITVNITNSTLKSTYIPVRVFNNGAGMNNVTIEDSTIEGVSRALWVHIYSDKDNGGKGIKDATLNLDIFENGNTYKGSNPNRLIEFGFDDEIQFFANGAQVIANGVGIKAGAYYIFDAEGYAWVESKADDFFAGKTIKLANNIDFNGTTLNPIRFWNPENKTIFDGQDFTLSNFNITNTAGNAGLFNGTLNIKNLKVKNATVEGKYVGVLAGNMYGNIDNCTVTNSTINGTYWQTGALCGQYNSGNVTNCTVENCTIKGLAAVGGLVGIVNESAGVRKFENCTVKNCDIVQTGSFGGDYDDMFGVVIGIINIENSEVYFNNCTIEGNTLKGVASDTLYGVVEDGTTVYEN